MRNLMMALAILCSFTGFTQERPQGVYVGLEKIYKTDSTVSMTGPYTPKKYQWFHLTYIEFRGDSVFLEQMPVSVYKEDTIYSASEGGLLAYSGTLSNDGTKLKADLILNECDTCPMRMIDFTPAQGASNDIEGLNTETEDKNARETKSRNKHKLLTIGKVRRSKNLTINGNIFRPQ